MASQPEGHIKENLCHAANYTSIRMLGMSLQSTISILDKVPSIDDAFLHSLWLVSMSRINTDLSQP